MNPFLPDFDRSIFIQGMIDQALVDKLTPQILALQSLGSKDPSAEPAPITVIIDSPGGNPVLGDRILGLMRAPIPDHQPGRVISYVTGRAASAAADFAIQSNYSYMVPTARMLCHGTSRGGNSVINAQTAESLAENLRGENEYYARRLAEAIFPRLLLLILSFGTEFSDFVLDPDTNLKPLAIKLASQLRSFQLRDLVMRAIERQGVIRDLSSYVSSKLSKRKDRDHLEASRLEALLLQFVLAKKVSLGTKSGWSLSRGGLEEVVADYRLLHDYRFGALNHTTKTWISRYGIMFLLPAESTAHDALGTNEDKEDYLVKQAGPRIRQLWYFCVSVSRLLQEEDYEFGAFDAYGMGLIDEVVGENLPSFRTILAAGSTVSTT